MTTIVSDKGPTLGGWIIFVALLVCGFASLGLIYWEYVSAKDTIDSDDRTENTENMSGRCTKGFEDRATQTEKMNRFEEKGTQTETKNRGLGGRWKFP